MADFPTSIYTERDTENLPGIVFDASKKQNLYSEDFQNHAAEIIAIEEALGENLDNVQASLGFTPENVANKKTTLADNSDTYYPSQKAVKTAVDAKQDSLGFTPENVANKKTTLADNSDTYYPSQKAVKTAVDNTAVWVDYTNTSIIIGVTSFTNKNIRYSIFNKICRVSFCIEGVSNGTSFSFSLPFASANLGQFARGSFWAKNNGVVLSSPGLYDMPSNGSVVNLYIDFTAAAWSNANAKSGIGEFFYEVV